MKQLTQVSDFMDYTPTNREVLEFFQYKYDTFRNFIQVSNWDSFFNHSSKPCALTSFSYLADAIESLDFTTPFKVSIWYKDKQGCFVRGDLNPRPTINWDKWFCFMARTTLVKEGDRLGNRSRDIKKGIKGNSREPWEFFTYGDIRNEFLTDFTGLDLPKFKQELASRNISLDSIEAGKIFMDLPACGGNTPTDWFRWNKIKYFDYLEWVVTETSIQSCIMNCETCGQKICQRDDFVKCSNTNWHGIKDRLSDGCRYGKTTPYIQFDVVQTVENWEEYRLYQLEKGEWFEGKYRDEGF